MSLIHQINCDVCGESLDFKCKLDNDEDLTILVDRCVVCAFAAYKEGFDTVVSEGEDE